MRPCANPETVEQLEHRLLQWAALLGRVSILLNVRRHFEDERIATGLSAGPIHATARLHWAVYPFLTMASRSPARFVTFSALGAPCSVAENGRHHGVPAWRAEVVFEVS